MLAQKRYEVIDSPTSIVDSTSAKITGVFTIGDSLIVLEGEMQSQVSRKFMIPPIPFTANLTISPLLLQRETLLSSFSHKYDLRNVVIIDPATEKPTETEILGIGIWKDITPNTTYPFYLVYNGKLFVGDEYLSVVSDSLDYDVYNFSDIHINNNLKTELTVNRIAYPTTTVNVRKGASQDSMILCKANPSTMMVAEVNPLDKSSYCKVVILRTGETGYVHKKYLSFGSILPKVSSGALKKVVYNGLKVKPTIEIFNNTKIPIELTVSGIKYKFKPKEKKVITANTGKCSLLATGNGCTPYYGLEDLLEGYSYSWEFVINKTLW